MGEVWWSKAVVEQGSLWSETALRLLEKLVRRLGMVVVVLVERKEGYHADAEGERRLREDGPSSLCLSRDLSSQRRADPYLCRPGEQIWMVCLWTHF